MAQPNPEALARPSYFSRVEWRAQVRVGGGVMTRAHPTPDDVRAKVLDEIARLGLRSDHVFVEGSDPCRWRAFLSLSGRKFEFGRGSGGQMHCWERTPDRIKHLVPPGACPVPADTAAVARKALIQVKYALEDPGFFVTDPPAI